MKIISLIAGFLCVGIIAISGQVPADLPKVVNNGKSLFSGLHRYALADPSGNLLTDYKYTSMSEWHGTDRMRMSIDRRFKTSIKKKNGKRDYYIAHENRYGYIDLSGKEVIMPIYSELQEYDGITAYPLRMKIDSNRYGYIDLDGNAVIPPKFLSAEEFQEGLACVCDESKKWGYINTKGDFIIEPKYQYAGSFWSGHALVRVDNSHWEIIDKDGKSVSSYVYENVKNCYNGLYIVTTSDKKCGVIKENGEILVPCKYEFSDVYDYWVLNKRNSSEENALIAERLYKVLYPLAVEGDGFAQYAIAQIISRKDGLPLEISTIPYNENAAFQWYLKAAENGVFDAYENVGFRYAEGDGVSENIYEAIKWYEKHAEVVQNVNTWNSLAYLYFLNNNLTRAKEYWRKSAAWHSLYAKDCLSKYEDVVINNTEIQDIHENNDISIDWLDNVNILTDKTYKTRACIRSKVRVASVEYYLNNALQTGDRAPSFVENEGCDFVAEHIFILTQGQNDIKIKVTDVNGNVGQAMKTVTYNPPSPPPSQKEKRLALVIGNNDYTYRTLPTLRNAINDARAMASQLRNLGYEVPEKNIVFNANKEEMWNAINLFIRESQHYDASLMYYAGHGLSPKGGANYLLPVDARIDYLDEVEREGLNSQTDLLQKLQESSCKVKILLLDCCNNCNVPERDARATNYSGGLSRMFVKGNPEAEGITIIHAAQPGKIAMDGNTNHSPFVSAFLECCQHNADTSWNDFISLVRQKVKESTGEKQIPYREGDIDGVFYLKAK